MAYRPTKLGMLIALGQHVAAANQLRAAYRRARGRTSEVVQILGVDRCTVRRWIHRLGIRKEIDKIQSMHSLQSNASGA